MLKISKITKVEDFYRVTLFNGTVLNVSEVMVLDFDGAENVTYRNDALNTYVSGINVESSLEQETQSAVLDQLNASAKDICFISSENVAALGIPAGTFSTIYVGDTSDLDVLGGEFSGIAETTGTDAAANKADNAFVLTNRIESVEELVETISHEAGHLAGSLTHDYANDGLTLDDFAEGNATSRIVIDNATTFSKANFTFANMTHSDFGAAIYNKNGTLSTTNVKFSNNSAKNGGAVIIGKGAQSTDIRGGVFSANRAEQAGGAVAIYANTYISGTLFKANSATFGGALRITSDAEITLLSAATFSGNSVATQGGAIYNEGTTNIDGGTFSGNSAGDKGGAICNFSGGTLNISKGTIFESNSATLYGAAILNNWILTVDSATFTRNSTNNAGGAIQNVHECTATITNALFSGNSATTQGGAILAGGTTTITGNTFISNIAEKGGAVAVRLDTGIGIFSNNTFSGNTATYGGAIQNFSSATINGDTFSDNTAISYGGAIYNNSGIVTITSATFTNNSALTGGGAILNAASASVNITSATFEGNSATNYGGAINNAGTVEIDGGTFKNNSATLGGAAILNAASASVNITSATFEGNSTTSYGGAINNAGSATIIGDTFTGNTATSFGGAIYNRCLATIIDAVFTGNSATSIGGAIYNDGGLDVTIEITGGTYTSNSTEKGGVIYNVGIATITSGTFTGNNATGHAGVIYNDGSATITSGTFTENKATNAAGAIFNYRKVSITNAVFTGNTAYVGGAIYNNGTATISGGTFSGNSAADNGGAVYNGGTATLLGGNVFSTATDTIYNQGYSNASTGEITSAYFNFSGANTLGGNLINGDYASVTFDAAATTTLTNSAKLVNNNGTAQTMNGKVLVKYGNIESATSSTDGIAVTFMEGSWNTGNMKVGYTAENAINVGSSFTNSKGAKLWYGSNNGKTGITDNIMELNANITDADYTKFSSLDSLNAAYANFDGIINVTGGSYTAHIYGNKAEELKFTSSGASMSSKYVVGGKMLNTANDLSVITSNKITISASVTAAAVLGGNQFASGYTKTSALTATMNNTVTVSGGTNTFSSFLAGGSLLNSTDASNNNKYTFSGSNTVTVNGGTVNSGNCIVVGGSIVGGKSNLTDNSTNTITLNNGTYKYVCGAGYLQNNSGSMLTKTGTTTINVNGGTYTGGIYGGIGASKSAYISRASVSGNVYINVNATNAISAFVIYGGCSGSTNNFTANTTITFSGNGSNLSFTGANSVVGGGNGTLGAGKGTSGTNTLKFNAFSGNFTAPSVKDFDTLSFVDSTVTFANSFGKDLNLSDVQNWLFDEDSSLNWQNGINNFSGDALSFELKNGVNTKTVLTGSEDVLSGWESAGSVKINNQVANFTDGSWVSDNFSMKYDSTAKGLVVTRNA